MSKKKKSSNNAWHKIRGDWGDISPVTKIIPNKKKNPKTKHKNNEFDE